MSGIMSHVAWNEGAWINRPVKSQEIQDHLMVTTAHESDFWRNTSYGFIHDSGHALVKDFPDGSAMEVSFILNYTGQFDQAGIIVYSDSQHWIKAGVESADGLPHVGAVVTAINSDWSLAPVPDWMGKEVTVRASRQGNAVTIRVRCEDEDQLIRVAPIDPSHAWRAGPHCASPVSTALNIQFTKWRQGDADLTLH
jgi:regulation of enolase protein 1 (concanavalin A-like superfamily)